MSNWSTHQFTRKGEQLRTKVEAGKCKLTLTKIKIGNGDATIGEVKDMNDLKSPQLVLGISSCDVSAEDDRICEVVGIASSSNVESAFSVTEMGLYANDPDVGEILYLVGIDTAPDDMPNKNAQSPVTLTYQFELVTSNMANVVAMISPAGLVTVKMLNAHRTAAELDHPERSVHKKHLHQDAYESPALTGTPTAPTAGRGTNDGQIASTAFVAQAIAALVNSAPGALDTLQELAAALGNDANFATTVTNALAGKVSKSGDTMTGALKFDRINVACLIGSLLNGNAWRVFNGHGNAHTGFLAFDITNEDTEGIFLRKFNKDFSREIIAATLLDSENNTAFPGVVSAAGGFTGNLKGTASNSDNVGNKSLQWILDQINAAKTGIVASNLAQNGWVKFANGLIVQWGVGLSVNKEEERVVDFPIKFPSLCFGVWVTTVIEASKNHLSAVNGEFQVISANTAQCHLFFQLYNTSSQPAAPSILAIGI